MHFPTTNRTSQAHALDPEVRRDVIEDKSALFSDTSFGGAARRRCVSCENLSRGARLEAAPDSGPLFQGHPCREVALGVFAVKQSARGIRLPLQTPVSAARAVELYLTPEHRGR